MKKVVSIIGARPQFIKLGPFSREIRKYYEEIIIHTGQHYDDNMSKIFFDDLEIPKPDYNLEVGSGSHGKQTSKMLYKIDEVLIEEKPSLTIVFGDTNSTIAGSLSASKLNIPIAHIEAGLRSHNRQMPEEINRILTDHCSTYLFSPTKTGIENLKNEGLKGRAYLTGDIMLDALNQNIKKAEKKSSIIEKLDLPPNNYYLMTLHRPYNVDEQIKIKKIINSLSKLNKTVVFPCHPRTRKMINKFKLKIDNILLTNPLGYLDFILLEKHAKKIVTDSGGIQKEAFFLHKPCVTLRSETEWTETLKYNNNILVKKINRKNILEAIDSKQPFTNKNYNPFGKGNAAKKISDILRKDL